MQLNKGDPGQKHWEEFVETLPDIEPFDFEKTLKDALDTAAYSSPDNVTVNRLMGDAITGLLVDCQTYANSVREWIRLVNDRAIASLERHAPWEGVDRAKG